MFAICMMAMLVFIACKQPAATAETATTPAATAMPEFP